MNKTRIKEQQNKAENEQTNKIIEESYLEIRKAFKSEDCSKNKSQVKAPENKYYL